jgi:hypothetical protein
MKETCRPQKSLAWTFMFCWNKDCLLAHSGISNFGSQVCESQKKQPDVQAPTASPDSIEAPTFTGWSTEPQNRSAPEIHTASSGAATPGSSAPWQAPPKFSLQMWVSCKLLPSLRCQGSFQFPASPTFWPDFLLGIPVCAYLENGVQSSGAF